MSRLQTGSLVKAAAGKESGGYYAVIGFSGCHALIADGRKRRIDSPKRKNPKHLIPLNRETDTEGITDKKLRNVLRELSTESTPQP